MGMPLGIEVGIICIGMENEGQSASRSLVGRAVGEIPVTILDTRSELAARQIVSAGFSSWRSLFCVAVRGRGAGSPRTVGRCSVRTAPSSCAPDNSCEGQRTRPHLPQSGAQGGVPCMLWCCAALQLALALALAWDPTQAAGSGMDALTSGQTCSSNAVSHAVTGPSHHLLSHRSGDWWCTSYPPSACACARTLTTYYGPVHDWKPPDSCSSCEKQDSA